MPILRAVDRYLNGIVMYKAVLYALLLLTGIAILLGTFGMLPFSGANLALSLLVLFMVTWFANQFCAWIFGVSANPESAPITAAILFFVLAPAESLQGAALLALAGAVAMASKYVLAIRRQHVFNPAAIAAVIVGIPTGIASWWVGTPALLVPVLVLSLLVARKIRRFELVGVVLLAGALATAVMALASYGQALDSALWRFLISGPALFFAAFMVTEPFTSPGTRRARLLFGAGVGALAYLPLHLGPLFATPELALCLGNAAAFALSMRRRVMLTLTDKEEIAKDTFAFRFVTPHMPRFSAGQYLEWTLPHVPDDRGIRRYFTIAAAPTESELQIGVKFFPDGSSFKKALGELEPGARLYAAQLGGDFVLPADPDRKLAFIAGGIGVTPFRSMVRHLIDLGEKRNITLFYATRTDAEIAYRPLWEEAAAQLPFRMIRVLADEDARADDAEHGFVTHEMLRRRLPDWQERDFYLSGPDAMVQTYKHLLRGMGVADARIHTDYFPGF